MKTSTRLEVFRKKGIFKNFKNFIGKHLCQSFLFQKNIKIVFLKILLNSQETNCARDCNFTKMILQHMCFPVNFATFLRNLGKLSRKSFILVSVKIFSLEFSIFAVILASQTHSGPTQTSAIVHLQKQFTAESH